MYSKKYFIKYEAKQRVKYDLSDPFDSVESKRNKYKRIIFLTPPPSMPVYSSYVFTVFRAPSILDRSSFKMYFRMPNT